MSNLFGEDFSSFSSAKDTDEIDFDLAASAFPDILLDGDITLPPPVGGGGGGGAVTQNLTGFSFDNFDAPRQPAASTLKVTGDDNIERLESEFPVIEVPPVSSIPVSSIPEDEPEVVRQWREKQQAEINARDEASNRRRNDTIATAERDIDEFYENYAKTKERSIRDNKNTEADFLADLQASLSAGTTWDRICTLIELQNSQSKTIARTGPGTTDLTRFKEVLLRLKREGETAPGASGY